MAWPLSTLYVHADVCRRLKRCMRIALDVLDPLCTASLFLKHLAAMEGPTLQAIASNPVTCAVKDEGAVLVRGLPVVHVLVVDNVSVCFPVQAVASLVVREAMLRASKACAHTHTIKPHVWMGVQTCELSILGAWDLRFSRLQAVRMRTHARN